MTDSFVVVAIPAQDDYVWRVSSEKVPHLTLLYLNSNLNDVERVKEYIQHVSDTVLRKFYLNVNRRGVLGDQSADVLFFDNGYWNMQMLEEFRTYLLDDNNIRQAYDTVEQFPKWTPHLTLGYPETPAKPDKRDYPGINSVGFDRIALWTENYSGTEFPLKTYDDEIARMSDLGEKFLSHYGVKGMKWGVIRSHLTSGGKKLIAPSDDHLKSITVQARAKIGGVRTLSNKDLRDVINRLDLEVKFKDLKQVKHNQSLIGKGALWAGRVFTDVLVGTAVSWFRRPGFSTPKYRSSKPRGFKVIDGEVVPQRSISN